MARLDDLIKRKLELYENADDVFLERIEKTQSAILKKVLGILNQFDTESGNIVNNETAMQLLVSLDKDIAKALRDSTYTDRVDEYLKKFDQMQGLNESLIEEANGLKLTKFNLNPIKTNAVKTISDDLASPFSQQSNIVNPIKQIVFNSVVTGMPIEQAKENLTQFIQGTATTNGHIQRFVGQIARDALTQYDGLVNDVIRKEYDLNSYRYVGSLVEDSRCQCVRWVKLQFLPFETLPEEIRRAKDKRYGRGMIPETNAANFARYRGGYNCRHMAIPIELSPEALEKAVDRVNNTEWKPVKDCK